MNNRRRLICTLLISRFQAPSSLIFTLWIINSTMCNCSIILKPYLNQTVNGSALYFANCWLAHVHFHSLTTLHTDKIGHVTSDQALPFFSCNVEKARRAWGRGYPTISPHFVSMLYSPAHNGIVLHTHTLHKPFLDISTFLAARSRWMYCFSCRQTIPKPI